jgi:hypothetical protein
MLKYTVSDGVITIGKATFAGCYTLKEVTLPSTLTHIGDDAFYECVSLSVTLQLPRSLEILGDHAFGKD